MRTKDGADEVSDGVFVGEDTDDIGATLDLGMEPFDRVGRRDRTAVGDGHAQVCDAGLDVIHEAGCRAGHLGPGTR